NAKPAHAMAHDASDINDDADLDSPEEVLRRVEEERQAAQAHADNERARHHAQRKKKPAAHERRQQEEAQQASQSVREIYRKLASALHPDREPDAYERDRKTALMQRVNQAYAANNLLDLLQLQLEAEQINPQHLAKLSEERLKHYNKVLAEQLAGLQNETLATEESLRMQFRKKPHGKLTPSSLMAHLRAQLQNLQVNIHTLRLQRRALEDPAELKRWLKAQRAALQAADF
ncbi:MAG TPA: molecular chaperone DnaJ, partial [Burkholderiaceae bacterium]